MVYDARFDYYAVRNRSVMCFGDFIVACNVRYSNIEKKGTMLDSDIG